MNACPLCGRTDCGRLVDRSCSRVAVPVKPAAVCGADLKLGRFDRVNIVGISPELDGPYVLSEERGSSYPAADPDPVAVARGRVTLAIEALLNCKHDGYVNGEGVSRCRNCGARWALADADHAHLGLPGAVAVLKSAYAAQLQAIAERMAARSTIPAPPESKL